MGLLKKAFKTFAFMRIGIILMALVALGSAIGVVILPGTFFETLLFKVLFALLLFNMVLCVIGQIAKINMDKKNKKLLSRSIALIVLHAGIALILTGAAINRFVSIRETIIITEGETVTLTSIGSDASPLFLRLNNFEITYHEDGSASQYTAMVELYTSDTHLNDHIISINNPLKFLGAKLYLLDYEYLLELEGRSNGGWHSISHLGHGDRLEFPLPGTAIDGECYVPNFDPELGITSKTDRPDNPQILYYFYNGKSVPSLMSAPIGVWIKVDDGLFYRFNGITPRVEFVYKYDPSLPIISAGGLMLLIGTLAAYIRPDRKRSK